MSSTSEGIDWKTFKTGVPRLAVEDAVFVRRVFELSKEGSSSKNTKIDHESECTTVIGWHEFLRVMVNMENNNRGPKDSKATFVFNVYDLDGDGYINRDDLRTMFLSSSMLEDDVVIINEVVHNFCNRVFHTFGAEKDGRLSLDHVLKYMHTHPDQDVWELFGRSMLQEL